MKTYTIKPLEWYKEGLPNWVSDTTQTPLYLIEQESNSFALRNRQTNNLFSRHDTLDEAMIAANIHHVRHLERDILLETTP